jgi:dipeptidyl aminopeptidase/acylaminoacyl peptidase
VVATAAVAAALACRPEPGLGSITLIRGGKVHVVDLATCRDRVRPRAAIPTRPVRGPVASPDGRFLASVKSSGRGRRAKQTIWVADRRTGRSRPVFSETQSYKTIGPGETPGPIMLLGWSGDDRWIFFMIDPGGSASIAADGLTLRVVAAAGGRPRRLARMLPYPDYLAWCGGRLVFTGGGDRVATHGKRLLVAAPPRWRPRPLVDAPYRAWGSLACSPRGRRLVAQSQRRSSNPSFFATRWALWDVGFDGAVRRLTSPPRSQADESPRFSRDGRALAFVRSRRGVGKLYALRGGRLHGPILSLGYSLGYYGHQDWWATIRWSVGR